MRRAVVFAHYDKDLIIDDYVIYYLMELKKLAETVIFVSCNKLPENEKLKLDGIVNHIIDEEHNEYDFGSYKRGFLYLEPNFKDFDELFLINDSCYGPFYPLKEICEKMENNPCDFWGMTGNNYGYSGGKIHRNSKRHHIQSYFISFKKQVFTDESFKIFMRSIKHEEYKKLVITNYEMGLSNFLKNKGFSYDTYVPKEKYTKVNNMAVHKWKELFLNEKMPLIKCSVLRLVTQYITIPFDWETIVLTNSDYPIELIKKNLERTRQEERTLKFIPKCMYKPYYNFIGRLPYSIKKYFTWINNLFMHL